jgi:pilus assembly protein CpaB
MQTKTRKNWLILVLALFLGAAAAVGASRYLSQRMAEIEARGKDSDTVRLVVAKTNLAGGATLSPDTVAVREVPRAWAHSGALTPDQYSRAEGAALAHPANAGEPILWAQLEGRRAPTFSTRLQAGQRAVTVPVDEISSLSGMVVPGDLIDIVVSVRDDKRNYTFTLLCRACACWRRAARPAPTRATPTVAPASPRSRSTLLRTTPSASSRRARSAG